MSPSTTTLDTLAEQVRQRAADLAARLSGPARSSATMAQERALLRMLGVDGLDLEGRPLAAATAERYEGSNPERLARGILLPFVVAMTEYDLPARQTALEVASGAIDLGVEARLLEQPEKLAGAETRAAQLLKAALGRFDANRTAAHDMRDVLGSRAQPWLGVPLAAAEMDDALAEVRLSVNRGADVIEVRVPANWEYVEARRQAGLDIPGLFQPAGRRRLAALRGVARSGGRRGGRSRAGEVPADEPVPAGSQRGLAALRRAADQAAAERGCYVSLVTITSAFAAPEQAVVAALERIDYVEVDPMREIVEDNLPPERALADHAFAHRLQARAGYGAIVGSGPLTLGVEVAAGMPADAATRSGRSLALQALGAELALADGLPPEQMLLGCIPRWLTETGDSSSLPLQAYLRRLVFPRHPIVIAEAVDGLTSPGPALVAALVAGDAALVLERSGRSVVSVASDLAASVAAARSIRGTFGSSRLGQAAEELASRTLGEAVRVLERLAADGWAGVVGEGHGLDEERRLGQSAVATRATGPGSAARVIDRLL